MSAPTFVSWCAGIGCFDLGLERAGWRCVGAVERDPFARKVYTARFGAPAFYPEDLLDVKAKDVPQADLWVGGLPCQDLSVAGKRAGIHGSRSGIIWRWLDLAAERRPRFLLYENVPGLLSGRADAVGDVERDAMGEPAVESTWFGALLGGVADAGYPHAAWRVLDARHFGVAQRRRRVFLLAARDPRDGGVAEQVLLESAGVRGRAATRGEARPGVAARARGGLASLGEQRVARSLGSVGGGQDPAVGKGDLIVAPTLLARTNATGGDRFPGMSADEVGALIVAATLTSGGHPNSNAPGRRAEDDVNLVAHTLQAADGHHGRRSPHGDGGDNLVVGTVTAKWAKGTGGPSGDECQNLVAATLTSGGHPNSNAPGRRAEDDVNLIAFNRGQITHPENRSRLRPGDPAPTLSATDHAHVAFTLALRGRDGETQIEMGGDVANALRAGAEGGGVGAKTPLIFIDAWAARGSSSPNQHPVKTDGLSDALDTTAPGAVFPTLRGFGHGWQGQQNDDAAKVGVVRRLTPMECERLQGLPDGHTCLCGVVPYSTAACKCPDGPRYRAIGNGGAVPVLTWIGRRLKSAMEAT